MRNHDTNGDADYDSEALALRALAWTLGEEDRAQRLLALTGLTADHLRVAIGQPPVLAAVIKFLEAYEPDLISCAEAIGTSPQNLVTARRELEA
ncbi:DUF3572 domain-containing protein [Parasphingopyxis lamellibrachiae]|uniref:Uncharacterized protein DUF3572 n=1 Tax=Parasphingopyxis lamellibrachiae TaxID=680125 RepID=A0A3D9FI08_9SPHN|nr:DUF3572 domain-containing protein [Parasphingopyxis lamellibrachiae]RED17415.1 uncharacterized protein DUF3572 [Parasphingopyxis lamellibrachiae]